MAEQNYNTRQKKLITDLLESYGDRQFSCEDLENDLRLRGTPVGRSTVYRFLMKLFQEGRLRKFSDDGKCATFSYIKNKNECEGHIHLKCNSCGKFIHLECDAMNRVACHIMKDHHFFIDNFQTVLYGICESCKAKE